MCVSLFLSLSLYIYIYIYTHMLYTYIHIPGSSVRGGFPMPTQSRLKKYH